MGEPPITDLGICNLYDAVLQIHMIPLEVEDFSPSHPCIDRHHKDGLQVLTGNSHTDDLSRLLSGNEAVYCSL